ncbi:VOC family protein [Stenotrophomonas indicatrix]|uniref:VOC family protein n=1 Tax=Stenotrophomonas indicatrix TaxID=2045451 RepID=UPI00264B9172|nr:VOC family protein [Stenotrophomonas indicatrix]MDN8644580.1 VOC family protein [Stenotrophomonas indicatrix]MDN8655603.1 VOC family protein [Stenotrophomonas indicatrix]
MRLLHLSLPVSDVASVAAYFRDVLQLEVAGDQVRIGWSTIQLQPANGRPVGGVHLAFNVPDNRFADAMSWLRARTPLQCNPEGLDYFALESSWQSQSVYFTGPDGLILELIGRRRLPASDRAGAFHGSELTCLSEVGLPSHDVDAVREQSNQRFGLRPISPPSPQFAPMGDDEGLLIVVAADRLWFPEQKDLPNAQGLQLQVADVSGRGELHDAALGWRVQAA